MDFRIDLNCKKMDRLTGRKLDAYIRVRTEIGQQNSRTFYIFSRIDFFVDSNSPNTAYTQDFFPILDCKHMFPSSSLFLPDFSSAYCLSTLLLFLPFLISALQGFTSDCIQFVLHVLEHNRIPWLHYC